VCKADNLPPSCAIVKKSGNLNFLEPSGPVQVCNGTALPLPWNNHLDLSMKKLSKTCHIIRNAKTCMSVSSLKVVYYAFFTWL